MKPDREARKALIDSLEVGDLIRLNGKLRVVRDIGRSPSRSPLNPLQVYSITLSIMRCSWTRRAYTTRNRSDLYLADLVIVEKGYGVDRTPLERILQDDICSRSARRGALECCDVIGVIA